MVVFMFGQYLVPLKLLFQQVKYTGFRLNVMFSTCVPNVEHVEKLVAPLSSPVLCLNFWNLIEYINWFMKCLFFSQDTVHLHITNRLRQTISRYCCPNIWNTNQHYFNGIRLLSFWSIFNRLRVCPVYIAPAKQTKVAINICWANNGRF